MADWDGAGSETPGAQSTAEAARTPSIALGFAKWGQVGVFVVGFLAAASMLVGSGVELDNPVTKGLSALTLVGLVLHVGVLLYYRDPAAEVGVVSVVGAPYGKGAMDTVVGVVILAVMEAGFAVFLVFLFGMA